MIEVRTMYARMFLSCLLLLLFVGACAAQTAKELNEQLLYILDQSETPSVETIKQLLDKGAEVNAKTDEGTALMMAVRRGHTQIVKLLLAAGAQVDAKHRLGDSALIMSAGRSIPEMNPPSGQPLPPPASEIMSLLLAGGSDPNFIGQWGHTALMEANTAAKVKLLLTHGAHVNDRDEMSKTALVHAVDRGAVEVVEALLQAGADASIPDEKGTTALMYALQEPSPYNREGSPEQRLEAARLLLKGKIGDVNAQNENGETSLMRAVDLGAVEVVKSLLDRGANVNLSDVLGSSATVRAYEKDQTTIQQLLKGRPTRSALNAFLRAAVAKKDEVKVRELLKAGADANYEYAIGFDHQNIKSTVLILAAQTGDTTVVKLLLAAGANVNAKGLLTGSEHGLEFGTALDATKNVAILNLLRNSQ
jgi:ankyrin repeat protein